MLTSTFVVFVILVFTINQCQTASCPEEFFQCAQGECIAKIWVCDAEIDCPDGSDELHCKPVKDILGSERKTCNKNEFRCQKDGNCISLSLRCNGYPECEDGSDEERCISLSPTIKDNSCSSVANNPCSQICLPHGSKFVCSCKEGYHLVNETNCAPKVGNPMLFMSSNTSLAVAYLPKNWLIPVKEYVGNTIGVAYFQDRDGSERVFWTGTELRQKAIFSSNLFGHNTTMVISSGLQHPEFLAIDWLGNNLYITDYLAENIVACSLHNGHCLIVLEEGLESPRGIALDPAKGLMFWSDWGSNPHIGKAGMDGSSRTLLATKMLQWPNCVAVDTIQQRVYWGDAKLQRIESIGYEGQERKVILSTGIYHPFSMALFGDKLYWSDWKKMSVDFCDKKTGKNHKEYLSNVLPKPMGIYTYYPLFETAEINPCSDSFCSHLCLLAPNGRHICACPAGFHLDEDFKTCIEKKDEQFIFLISGNRISKFHPVAVGNNTLIEIPLEPGNLENNLEEASAAAVDLQTNMAYFAERYKKKIIAVNMTNHQFSTLLSTEIGLVEDMSFDSVAKNLYWIDRSLRTVEVLSTSNFHRKILINVNGTPLALAIVSELGILFFSQIGDHSTINRMNMDGSNEVAISDITPWMVPSSLAVDVKTRRLYWADSTSGRIRFSSLDGKFQKTLASNNGFITSLLFSMKRLYWTEKNIESTQAYVQWKQANVGHEIFRIPLQSNNSSDRRASKMILMISNNANRTNPCENSHCSHLCLLNSDSYSCSCPTGLFLGSDGKTCTEPKKCSVEHFLCKNKIQCVLISRLCNGRWECDDGSDEFNCTKKISNCTSAITDPSCMCGYKKLRDEDQCKDINECQHDDYNTCSQTCINTEGSYTCTCKEGYVLQTDGRCIAEGEEPILIFSADDSVRTYGLRSTILQNVYKNLSNMEGIAYDGHRSLVYWTSIWNGKPVILSSRLDGSAGTIFIERGLQSPQALAVDWIGDNLYLTDLGSKHIAACSIEKENCHVILNKGLEKPRGIALDPLQGYMYWTDWGKKPHIGKAGMDGSRSTFIVETLLGWPNHIVLDDFDKRLYWVDGKLDRIESIGVDGKNRKLLFDKAIHPFGIFVFEDDLFWSDWELKSIQSINKRTGKNQKTIAQLESTNPNGLQIYHPILQKEVSSNPCSTAKCSHICLLTPSSGHSCVCPSGYRIGKDSKTCEEYTLAPGLIVTHGGVLAKYYPDRLGGTPLVPIILDSPIGEISAMEYDWETRTLFIADAQFKKLIALDMNTKDMHVLLSEDFDGVKDMAIDFTARNLYWVNSVRKTIEVMSLRNRQRTTLLKLTKTPVALTLSSNLGIMIVAFGGNNASLEIIHLDGKMRKVIFRYPPLIEPTSITFDKNIEGIFIADSSGVVIYHQFKEEGHALLRKNFGHPMMLTIFGSKLFWTDKVSHKLYWHVIDTKGTYNPFNDEKCSCDFKYGSVLATLTSHPLYEDTRSYNPCSEAVNPCSHICLLNPLRHSCACPDNYILGINGKTCIRDP